MKLTGQRNYPEPTVAREASPPAVAQALSSHRAGAFFGRKRTKRVTMTVRLPPGLRAQLRAFAERTGLSMNEMICSAIAFATK